MCLQTNSSFVSNATWELVGHPTYSFYSLNSDVKAWELPLANSRAKGALLLPLVGTSWSWTCVGTQNMIPSPTPTTFPLLPTWFQLALMGNPRISWDFGSLKNPSTFLGGCTSNVNTAPLSSSPHRPLSILLYKSLSRTECCLNLKVN